MKNLSIIASIGKNRELGYQNDLIWRIKEDLQFFKETTMGSYIIMGKNTFNSLPKNLPGRKYVVLTSDLNLCTNDKITVLRNLKETLEFVKSFDSYQHYVIGGGQVYSSFLPYVDSMYLTEIDAEFNQADTFFPEFDKDEWKKEEGVTLQENDTSYKHVLYLRKNRKI